MSLGFLTESALIPKKSKEIKVDKSIVRVLARSHFQGSWTEICNCPTRKKAG